MPEDHLTPIFKYLFRGQIRKVPSLPPIELNEMAVQHPHHTRPGHISPEADDIIVYVLLAIATLVLLGGAVVIIYTTFFREAEPDPESLPLIPDGYADPEGYGSFGIHVSNTNLIRKAYTMSGVEVDYLSD